MSVNTRPRSPLFVPSEAKSDVVKAADALAAASRLLRRSEQGDAAVAKAQADLAPFVEKAQAAKAAAAAFLAEHGPYLKRLNDSMNSETTLNAVRGMQSGYYETQQFCSRVAELAAAAPYAISTIDRVSADVARITASDLRTGVVSVSALKYELTCVVGVVDDLKPRLVDVRINEPKIAELIEKFARVQGAK
jgi:hypothetical protein